MARAENLHSRLVAWMKILLPLAALAILSTLFLISRSVDPTREPVTDIDLERRALEQGATRPRLAGMTRAGDQITFSAQSARPDPADAEKLFAERVLAEIRLKQGNRVTIAANRAELRRRDMKAALSGAVDLSTADGYRLRTDRLNISYDTLLAQTPGAVSGTGPPGQIEAGRMTIRRAPDSEAAEMLFTDGVRLVYDP